MKRMHLGPTVALAGLLAAALPAGAPEGTQRPYYLDEPPEGSLRARTGTKNRWGGRTHPDDFWEKRRAKAKAGRKTRLHNQRKGK